MKSKNKLIFAALIIVAVLFAYHQFNLGDYFSFDWLQQNAAYLSAKVQNNFWTAALVYFLIYVIATALSFPGAAVLTLAGGFLFGLFKGLVIVSFASALGASLAFVASKFFLRDWVKSKFRKTMEEVEEGVKREGKLYLFSLRLIPIFPFFLINLVMGLTGINLSTYYWVSQLGMLPGTFVYVNAGTQLAQISSPQDIFSFELLLAFSLLGAFPILAKFILKYVKARKVYGRFKKPGKFDYNIAVVGAGSAGLVASYIAAAVKANVALIEKNKMGGDCLNTGCVPSKALIKSAKVAKAVRESKSFGIQTNVVKVDFKTVMERVRDAVKKIEPHDSIERYTSLGVDCFQSRARILSPFEIELNNKKITAKNIIVATGARPLVPNIPGLPLVSYYTSDTIWELEELPEKLLVLGGGPIGCELAQAFARLGSEVTLVEMGQRLLKVEDEEVSSFVAKKFEAEGVRVLTSHKAVEFKRDKDKQTLLCANNGGHAELEFTHVLLALGRKANASGFGLEELGIELNKNGTISHNAYMQTKYPNILVCGDVAGPYQFTHTASHQAWYASVNALFSPIKKFKADYKVIPWCTFIDPEVARVGLNEQEAGDKGIDFEVFTYSLDDLDRAIADSEDEGFVKVLVERGKEKILGATIVGTHAADMIAEFVIAMKHGIGLNKILGTIHLYPSYMEGNKYVAGRWKQATKPEKLLKLAEKFHKLRR